jgi:membrane-associated phospholipid phosphatase
MPSSYPSEVVTLARLTLVQLVRPPSHPRAKQAARRLLHQTCWLAGIGVVVIIAMMFELDASEIGMMPPRGSPGLWPFRILTEFGKDACALSLLAATLIAIALVAPRLQGRSRLSLLGFGMRVEFLFLAVQVPVLAGEIVQWIVGRGRPFVGGRANAFNFAPFTGSEAYFSFPSAHSITAFALAFAVAAIWPRARVAMFAYAILIAITRLVLLAHHPSDVVAGALFGVIGAMWVRYWFAARRLGFTIDPVCEILPLMGPALSGRKGVARRLSAP